MTDSETDIDYSEGAMNGKNIIQTNKKDPPFPPPPNKRRRRRRRNEKNGEKSAFACSMPFFSFEMNERAKAIQEFQFHLAP